MSKKILLIDDSITIHRVIDLSIDDTYEVQKVFSAEEANSTLNKFTPDVVLLDNKLDNAKINELIKEIKSKVPSTKLVLLVGAFDQFDETDAQKLGADDFLVKPFNSTSLEEILESMLPKGQPEPVEKTEEVVEQEPTDDAVEELRATIEDTEEKPEEFIFDEINEELEFDKKNEIVEETTEVKEAVELESEKGLNVEDVDELEETGEAKSEDTLDDIFGDLELNDKPQDELEPVAEKENILDEVLENETLEDIEKIEEPVIEEAIIKKPELDLEDLLDDDLKGTEDLDEFTEEAKEETTNTSIVTNLLEEKEEEISFETSKTVLEDLESESDKEDGQDELVLDEISPEDEDEVVLESVSEEEIFTELETADDEKIEDILEQEPEKEEILETEFEVPVKDEASKIASEVLVGGAAVGAAVLDKDKPVDEVKPSDDSKSEKTEVVKVNKEQVKAAVADVLNEEFLKDAIKDALAESLEKVIWAVIPDLAEKLILQEIEKLKKGE